MFRMTDPQTPQLLANLDAHIIGAMDLSRRLEKASDYVYEETRHRFDTEGDGEWPQLTESTVAKKVSQGYGEPARVLYADGNLFESATSPHGPYSQRIQVRNASGQMVVMLVDWDNDGWQIPTVLAEGSEHMPARPIWPPPGQVQDRVREILMGL